MTIQFALISLPESLVWTDEHAAAPVAQTVKRALDGRLVVQAAPLIAGRPITLQSGADVGWITKAQVDAVRALADQPGATFALTLRGNSYMVMFRHHEPPAFEAAPLWPWPNPGANDYHLATIKLITI